SRWGVWATGPYGGLCVGYFPGQVPRTVDDYAFALDKEVASLKVNVAEVSA
ncbi:MAG: amidophosphoribosyltransferase, partial [Lacticaseibacillus paracasei]